MTNLDFRNRNKKTLVITFDDEAQTRLSLLQPTKLMFERIMTLSSQMEATNTALTDIGMLDTIYDICAELISRNLEGKTITKSKLTKLLDLEDIVVFLQTYISFVAERMQQKN